MKYLIVAFAISMSVALASGQFFGPHFRGGFRGHRGYALRAVHPDFGPSAFSGGFGAPSIRDPRQNRGPVVFPPSPPDAPEESSGVIVGASGYGFVPPGSARQSQFESSPPNLFNYYQSFSYY